MKYIIYLVLYLFVLSSGFSRELNVITTYPYIASIVEKIGGEKVKVKSLADGRWDPHTIIPKPSYIAQLRNADLLIINGAQLEIGWLPQLVRQANNPAIHFDSKGFLNLSRHVQLIDIPRDVSRASGDVHPEGNPHFYLDYENILPMARAIKEKLVELNPENQDYFIENLELFKKILDEKIKLWQNAATQLKGLKVIEYHKIFDYFLLRTGIIIAGTIEPLPGIPPSSRHIETIDNLIKKEQIKHILQDVYNPSDASEYLARKNNIKMIKLPHDVGTTTEAKDIFSLIDTIFKRLLND